MKVGFDISQLAYKGGVVTYTKNLAEQLAKMSELEMVFFYSSMRKPYHGSLKNVKRFHLPPTALEIIFNKFRKIPIERFIGSLDIFHSSDWTFPKTSAKKVTTYHDVVPLKYPQWSHPKIISVHKKRLELVEKEIDMIIAVSHSTKKDLLEISKIPEDKITVIYEGVDEKFKPQNVKDIEQFRQKYKLPDEFILAIGGVGERRNLKRVKEASKNYNLVIAGETIPWISEQELPLLYSAAKVLFYPSLYEGFGLPILEAMACGTPVITSNVSSMPEVGGSASAGVVLYVNPESIEEMQRSIGEIMGDKGLREQMIKKGFLQAKKFSWEKCAKETAKVYQEVMKR
ncbi:MAG: glycosyltransferase family 1 protein [Candidatus Daviesbacteria bacterium]|nr:glycosyltransferase family 1 protein [Candidatus Daviesbacteria bacterium]